MSLSQSGDSVHRAHVQNDMPTGGESADVDRMQATEDRKIVGILISKTFANGGVTASFSSDPGFTGAGFAQDNTKSSILFYVGEQIADTVIEPDASRTLAHWDAGEELHFHTRNNSGVTESFRAIVYYVEA